MSDNNSGIRLSYCYLLFLYDNGPYELMSNEYDMLVVNIACICMLSDE